MGRFFFFFSILAIVTGLVFFVRFAIKFFNKRIWNSPVLERAATFYPYLFLILITLSILMRVYFAGSLPAKVFITLNWLFLLLTVVLVLVVPFLLILYLVFRLSTHQKRSKPNFEQRRQVLKWMGSALPVAFLSTGGVGVAGAFSEVRIPYIPLYFKQLPPLLDGFKILHLSDLHLGYYFNLQDLRLLIDRLMYHPVDLVLVTGDLADDLEQLEPAIEQILRLETLLPKFFSLGNHEYFRDLNFVLKTVEKSSLVLLRNQATLLEHNNVPLRLIGIDDPVYLRRDNRQFLKDALQKAHVQVNPASFNILMSHRPRAIEVAPEFNVDLVLSGHTHGGQLGLGGRSLFERLGMGDYLWGTYSKANTYLYTSAGIGHWLPFRLGCPPEAPILELKKIP